MLHKKNSIKQRAIIFFGLLSAVLFLSAGFNVSSAAIIFSDNFEASTWTYSGAGWNGQNIASGCSLAVVSSTKNTGDYGLFADFSTNGGLAYVYKDISRNYVYVRFYVYFPTGFFSVLSQSIEKVIMRVYSTSGNYVEIFCKNYSGSRALRIQYNATWNAQGYSGTLTENTWYNVEVYAPIAANPGVVRWWVNNIEQDPVTDDLSAIGTWNQIMLGSVGADGSPHSKVSMDDFVIADNRIGPIGSDLTPPDAVAVVRDGTTGSDIDSTNLISQLSANWDAAVEPESSVRRYWYAISTYTASPTLLSYSSTTATTITATGTYDVGTTYYFTIKAENTWDQISDPISSDGQFIEINDATPPSTIATVNDGILVNDSTTTYSKDRLSGSWIASTDAESGIKKYWYAIGTTAGATDTLSWTDNGKLLKAHATGLTLSAGMNYYFTVKAENGVGLMSVPANSNGITVLNTRPDEYVWLHADDKYIKRSPYCTKPNEIWQGAGVCYRGEGGATAAAAFATWAKSHHVNCVRISYNCIKTHGPIQTAITNYIDPLVQALKAQQIYSYIDCHEYMVDYTHLPSEGYSPDGPGWDVEHPSEDCQEWLDDWEYLAYYYKDEGWVMGYELCNEPKSFGGNTPNTTYAMCRNNFIKCLQNIRKIDTKHIVLLGNNGYTNPQGLINTWVTGVPDAEKLRPDAPYHNVVFAFHGYLGDTDVYLSWNNNPSEVDYANDYVSLAQNTYNVPLYCTETGHEETAGTGTEDVRRQYQMQNIEMCYGKDTTTFWNGFPGSGPRKVVFTRPIKGSTLLYPKPTGHIGWSIWSARGSAKEGFEHGVSTNADSDGNVAGENICIVCGSQNTALEENGAWYMDIWPWAAQKIVSAPPETTGSVVTSDPSAVICTAISSLLLADGNQTTLIEVKVVDNTGNRLTDYSGSATLSLSGPVTWADGTTANKTVAVAAGYASTTIKTTTVHGTITITATVGSLTPGTATIKAMQTATKVVLKVNPPYIPADNTTLAYITAYLKNDSDETVTLSTATFTFSVDKPEIANTYVTGTETEPVNSRITTEGGITYMAVKSAGTTPGIVVVTGSVTGLTSGNVTVFVGQAIPIELVKSYPNPMTIVPDSGSEMIFTNVPSGSELRIYSLSGKLVCSLTESGNAIHWDGKNTGGNYIAQGIYLYSIKDTGGQKKTGKIAVKRN